MSEGYQKFLKAKLTQIEPVGFEAESLNLHLFDWQAKIVSWALARGRAALFEDCGLGKTLQQLAWADEVAKRTGRPVLILTPLAVAEQTEREAGKFGIFATHIESPEEVGNGVYITNYEKLHHFDPIFFGGIVLDESSILKSFDGKTRKALMDFASTIPYRLCCTATPAPNDLIELTNHAEFLSIMSGKEIIALYFTQDGNTTHKWRLKGHAKKDFWRWMAQWCVATRKPSDLGFSDDGFDLPELRIHHVELESKPSDGYLFAMEAKTLQERRQARRDSLAEKVRRCAAMINESNESWSVWCGLNAESEALADAIKDSVEVRGSDKPSQKIDRMMGFSDGRYRVIVTKPSIAGFGMNWQHCSKVAVVGLSDSFEELYQLIRRHYRFGQKNPVDVYVFASEAEGAVVANIQRKEAQAAEMMESVIAEMREFNLEKSGRQVMDYKENTATGDGYTLFLGDCVKRIDEIESESIGFSAFSPPYPGMYAYSNSPMDMGNCDDIDQMIQHFRFLVAKDKLYRVMMTGRNVAIHLTQLTAMKSRDGYIGLKDYRGRTIQMMIEEGWIYAGEICIDKNPQIQATRNKERGLLFKSLAMDASVMRMALADYVLLFRKPGENPLPIRAGISEKYSNKNGWITEQEWVEWAAPVWYRHVSANGAFAQSQPSYPSFSANAKQERRTIEGLTLLNGIQETDVLNVAQARETDDERHLCPLQLGVIERCVKLWSAPGDTVFSPFAGIGSEGYVSLRLNRKFIGCELKESYWKSARINLERGLKERREAQRSMPLLSLAESA